MSEMQFYKRLWRAKEDIPKFDFDEIKRNLRRNRFVRNQQIIKEVKHGKGKTVDFDRERQKLTEEESSSNEKEGRWV